MSRDAVTLAYLHDTRPSHSFQDSLQNLVLFDLGGQGLLHGGYIAMRCTGGVESIVEGRNKVAKQFLDTDSDYLFWLDDDMGFEADALQKLHAVADPETRPIVAGLCFAAKETETDGYGGFRVKPRVTIMDYVDAEQAFVGRAHYQPNSLTRCGATGSACILIHRSVFERIRDEYGDNWYTRTHDPAGRLMGEDVSFCARAGALGIPVCVHSGVRTTHFKHLWLGEADYWEQYLSPPATDRVAVVVPVLGRPQQAAPFMTSLRASTGLCTAYAVCDPGDPARAAWAREGAVVVPYVRDHEGLAQVPDVPGTFAEKVNCGYATTEEPWLFLVGSDVTFHPGWLDHAQWTAKLYEASVIGTNDLGNPRVMRGEHATHLLIARDYIDDVGASWDGPKVVCHEGYKHWYVDDEIVTAARQRGVWEMALASRVEHLHPLWGKGEDDDVYQLGQSHAEEDGKLFKRRLRQSTKGA